MCIACHQDEQNFSDFESTTKSYFSESGMCVIIISNGSFSIVYLRVQKEWERTNVCNRRLNSTNSSCESDDVIAMPHESEQNTLPFAAGAEHARLYQTKYTKKAKNFTLQSRVCRALAEPQIERI